MSKIILASVILLFAICTNAQSPTDPRLKGLDSFVLKVLKDLHAPGVTIAVVEKNKVVYTGGFGFRDIEKNLPVTENTLFRIASCTKAFTVSILGMLEKEGKVSFDKPVRNYLPELKFYNEYTNDHVTIRDMMTHRTGVPRHDRSWVGSSASRNELLERSKYLEPSAELREKFQYNNYMFMALGAVIEKITGKSWEDNMNERILKPLGMGNTNLSLEEMKKSPDYSLAYVVKKDSVITAIPYQNMDVLGSGGAVNTCAKDMANWLITWIYGGKFNGKEIIPSSLVNQAITIQMSQGSNLPGAENPDIHPIGYGLAWQMRSYRGHYQVFHYGGTNGFAPFISFFPSDSIGIFIVSNQGDVRDLVSDFIADHMLNLPWRNWNWNLKRLEAATRAKTVAKSAVNIDSLNRKKNTKPAHSFAEYTGTYLNPGYDKIMITQQGDSLFIEFRLWKYILRHYHYEIFKTFPIENVTVWGSGIEGFKLTFHSNSKGEVESISARMESAVKEIVFTKEIKAIKLAKSELDKYVGEYDLNGTTAKVYTRENTLYVFLPGQPEYELIAMGNNVFNLKILNDRSLQFNSDNGKTINNVYFIGPNGASKAPRIK